MPKERNATDSILRETAKAPHHDVHGEFTEHGEAALDGLDSLLELNDEIEVNLETYRELARQQADIQRRISGHVLLTPGHEIRALFTAMHEAIQTHASEKH